jgi:arylsulfatase A-like enzyme
MLRYVLYLQVSTPTSVAVDISMTTSHPTCQGGIRSPSIVRWPGVVKPGVVSDFPWTFYVS